MPPAPCTPPVCTRPQQSQTPAHVPLGHIWHTTHQKTHTNHRTTRPFLCSLHCHKTHATCESKMAFRRPGSASTAARGSEAAETSAASMTGTLILDMRDVLYFVVNCGFCRVGTGRSFLLTFFRRSLNVACEPRKRASPARVSAARRVFAQKSVVKQGCSPGAARARGPWTRCCGRWAARRGAAGPG